MPSCCRAVNRCRRNRTAFIFPPKQLAPHKHSTTHSGVPSLCRRRLSSRVRVPFGYQKTELVVVGGQLSCVQPCRGASCRLVLSEDCAIIVRARHRIGGVSPTTRSKGGLFGLPFPDRYLTARPHVDNKRPFGNHKCGQLLQAVVVLSSAGYCVVPSSCLYAVIMLSCRHHAVVPTSSAAVIVPSSCRRAVCHCAVVPSCRYEVVPSCRRAVVPPSCHR